MNGPLTMTRTISQSWSDVTVSKSRQHNAGAFALRLAELMSTIGNHGLSRTLAVRGVSAQPSLGGHEKFKVLFGGPCGRWAFRIYVRISDNPQQPLRAQLPFRAAVPTQPSPVPLADVPAY